MTTGVLRHDAAPAGNPFSPRAARRSDMACAATTVRAPWPLRGLVFDLGDVLYDATAWRRWLHGLLQHLGVVRDYATLFAHWDDEYLDAVHRGARDYQEAFVAFLGELGLVQAQIDEVCAASAARRREIAASLRPLPGVRPTLERLHAKGFLLGVLSDSEDPAPRLRERLIALGIGGPVSVVISSIDLGRTKPAPSCYETALAAMDLLPSQAAFVGHDAKELGGAADVGMRTIAFNHEPEARADLYLRRFEDLSEYVICGPQGTATAPSSTRPLSHLGAP